MGCKISFAPMGISVIVNEGVSIHEAAKSAGVAIDSPCAGRGKCGKCRVLVKEANGVSPPEDQEKEMLTPQLLSEGYRLACLTKVIGDTEIIIPTGSLLENGRILTHGRDSQVDLCPAVRKVFLRVEAQTLNTQESDLTALKRALAETTDVDNLSVDIDVLRQMPRVLRDADYSVTAVLRGNELISLEIGDTTHRLFGLAVDIGTTTVVGSLIDLKTGGEITASSEMNPQAIYGGDVVSRLTYAIEHENGLTTLRDKIVGAINKIIGDITLQTGISPDSIYDVTVVGNSAMHHLFLGIPPDHLATLPYVPVVSDAVDAAAWRLGLRVNPLANVHFLPNIAGFVGADTVGVIIATGLGKRSDTVLAIDIGTNGEVVLSQNDRILVCSTAAGPAFEGANITHGMRASSGAIEAFEIKDDFSIEIDVIGNSSPAGICGSGIFDVVAELLRIGVIDNSGRMVDPELLIGKLPPSIIKRMVNDEERGAAFIVATDQDGDPILITQSDVRQVQLAKGAIRAGVEIMLSELGIAPDELDEILLAGAFGNYLRKRSTLRIGIIPPVAEEKIKFIGNAAMSGAKMALISTLTRKQAAGLVRSVEYVPLATNPEFQMQFMEAMLF